MRTKKKQWIGGLLLIVFLLSGVCFGDTNTDFFLMYQTSQQEIPHKQTLDLKFCNSISCTAEVLETRDIIQLINTTAKQTGLNLNGCLLFLLLAAMVLHLFSCFCMVIYGAYLPRLCQSAIVLHYIHNMDGAK